MRVELGLLTCWDSWFQLKLKTTRPVNIHFGRLYLVVRTNRPII